MALTETRPTTEDVRADHSTATEAGSVERLISTGDHLVIGRTFIVAAFFFAAISALGLVVSGIDTAVSNDLLGDSAPLIWNSSLVGMILSGVLPLLLGLALYLVPLQVASPSVSFPRAAALSLWGWLIGVLIFAVSVALKGGVAGTDPDAAKLGNLALGVMLAALILGSVCAVTTVVTHRPPAMSLARVPLFSWSILVAAPIWIMNLGAAFGGVILGYVGDANAPGLATNYQSMIAGLWSAPGAYMLAIPVLGIAGDVTAKVAGRRISQYGLAQGLIGLYGFFSFSAWALSPRASQTFVFFFWVLIPGLAVLALLGLYGDTIRRSKLSFTSAGVAGPMSLLLVLGGVLAAGLGVVDTIGKGTLFGFDASQLAGAQSIFLIAAGLCGAVGGTAFWGEKLWGHSSDALAKPAVAFVFTGGGLLGTVLALQGVLAASSPMGDSIYGSLLVIAAGVFSLGLIASLVSALGAASAGHLDPIADDPNGLTLEWNVASPPDAAGSGTGIPSIKSPYPLLDLREGATSDGESQ